MMVMRRRRNKRREGVISEPNKIRGREKEEHGNSNGCKQSRTRHPQG